MGRPSTYRGGSRSFKRCHSLFFGFHGRFSFHSIPEDIVKRCRSVILSQPAVVEGAYSGKKSGTGTSTLAISLRSIAMPTSSDVTLFDIERMSCLVVALNSYCPSVPPHGLSWPAKYRSNTSLP